jgi:predicted MFS family arabinose efflux permease
MEKTKTNAFTSYEKLVIAILALTQFSVVLDFMVISPLGAFLIPDLSLKPSQFGWVVSGYAFSAGASGFLTAGFADKFDRKNLLIFFYSGFIAGTLFCGLANSYYALLFARIVTGLFGGVIGSISMAIVTDLFPFEKRGRVVGYLTMGFGASQVLGIPIALWLAHRWGWQSPFWLVAGLAFLIAILIVTRLKPVRMHLEVRHEMSPLRHLINTIEKRDYRIGFTATALLSIGGFMMMPFGSAFAVNNLRVDPQYLSFLFLVSGLTTFVIMPMIGKLSDKFDKYRLFVIATLFMSVLVITYTHLGPQPLWVVMIFNILMMTGIFGRVIPANAITTAIPEMRDRGAFMSINSSLQQIAGGLGAIVAGKIVVQASKTSPLEHYDWLGFVVVGISFIAASLMYRVDLMIKQRRQKQPAKPDEAILSAEELPEAQSPVIEG